MLTRREADATVVATTASHNVTPGRPPLSFQCWRLTAKILLRRLWCQEDLCFKIFGPPSAGTIGGPKEEGGPSQTPSPPSTTSLARPTSLRTQTPCQTTMKCCFRNFLEPWSLAVPFF